jgi:hypothetical protein
MILCVVANSAQSAFVGRGSDIATGGLPAEWPEKPDVFTTKGKTISAAGDRPLKPTIKGLLINHLKNSALV